jgi:thiosulfate reductase/polysulfide reductase chain A
MVPNAKVELGEFMFLPWDDPTAARVDELDKNFPLAAKGDGVYLRLRENVIAGQPYPVKCWMVYKQDPVNAVPDQDKTLQMLRQMDFVGVIDIQMSDTAWYADVVLPESTYLERLDPVEMLAGIRPVVLYRQPVVKPLYDTKPLLEIVQGLAKRLKLSQYFDYTMEQWIAEQVKTLPMDLPLEYMKKHGAYSPPQQVGKDRAFFTAFAGSRIRPSPNLSPSLTSTCWPISFGPWPSCLLHPCQHDELSLAQFLLTGKQAVDSSQAC